MARVISRTDGTPACQEPRSEHRFYRSKCWGRRTICQEAKPGQGTRRGPPTREVSEGQRGWDPGESLGRQGLDGDKKCVREGALLLPAFTPSSWAQDPEFLPGTPTPPSQAAAQLGPSNLSSQGRTSFMGNNNHSAMKTGSKKSQS